MLIWIKSDSLESFQEHSILKKNEENQSKYVKIVLANEVFSTNGTK